MEPNFSLSGKTTILSGRWDQQMISMTNNLCRLGSDVGIISQGGKEPQRMANLLNDEREVNPKYGRCLACSLDSWSQAKIKDAVEKVAEGFGAIDIMIDSHNQLGEGEIREDSLRKSFESNFWPTIQTLEAVEPYLVARQKGRIILLIEGPLRQHIARAALIQLTKSYAKTLAENNISLNVISPKLTESYLRTVFPKEPATEAMKRFQVESLTEPDHITQSIAFLASNSSIGISGQLIEID